MKNVHDFYIKRSRLKYSGQQDPNHSNVDNLNNGRREASRHFRGKKKEKLKIKIDELETNSKNKNIIEFYRGISEINTLRTGDADLRFYIKTVQDG